MTPPVQWYLAQVNIGKMTGENINDPIMKDFVDALDEVNAVAERSNGFVWRLKDDNNNATGIDIYADQQIIFNLSVWQSIEHLEAYVYNGEHLAVLKRRREWFVKFGKPFMALWYVPAGHAPTVQEAKERLAHLQEHGPSLYAFDFKSRYPAPADQVQVTK